MGSSDRPLAVITGASSGIGYELAKIFAREGFDLLINAEDDELAEAERELRALGGEVGAERADLAEPAGVEAMHERIGSLGRPVRALVLNAGIGEGGAFATQTDLAKELKLIDLNVRSVVHVTKLELPAMIQRGDGKLLFTSSIASTIPGAFQAVYNASKSFVQSFALAIRNELKDTGVTVTSLMPGPTETEFFERAGMEDTRVGQGKKDDAAEVAREGFEALMAGEEKVIAGSFRNRLQSSRFIPDRAKAQLHRKMAEPGSAEKS